MKTMTRSLFGYFVLGTFLSGSVAWGADNPAVPSVPGTTAVTSPAPQAPQQVPQPTGAAAAPSPVVRDMNGAPLLIVEFQTDHSDIPAAFKPQLNAFGHYLKNHPESTADIAGHADNAGHGPANDALSQKRADTVVAYLMSHYGIAMNRMKASGYGATMDKPNNSTVAAQQYDRRVYGTISMPKA
jgi:outer membrane protein OmpA-like peptidoglycan-associated protein